MTKIINGSVVATLRVKLDISLDVPEDEIDTLAEELFNDNLPHTFAEMSVKLKELIENELMPPSIQQQGAKVVCHQSELTREA